MRPSEVGTGGRIFILFCPPTDTASRFTHKTLRRTLKTQVPASYPPYSGSHHKSTPSPLRRLDLGSCHSPGALTP